MSLKINLSLSINGILSNRIRFGAIGAKVQNVCHSFLVIFIQDSFTDCASKNSVVADGSIYF